jgi:hypothetical protein
MEKRVWRGIAGVAKKTLFLLATIILVWAFAQTLPFDLAILLAGDTLLYAEIVSAVWIASRLANVKAMAGWAKLVLRRRIRRSGLRRALRARTRAARKAPSSDDERRAGTAPPRSRIFAPAFAFA